MNIEKKGEGTSLELKIIGRLESTSAPQLNSEIDAVPAETKELVIDLSQLEYTSSAGLRCILVAHKLMKSRCGRMMLKGVTPSVKKLLDMTGFTPLLSFI